MVTWSESIVVSGGGLISPLGDSSAQLHAALIAGRSGIGPISLFPTEARGGEIRDFDAESYLGRRNLRMLDRIGRLATAASGLALADAEITSEWVEQCEVGCVVGTMLAGVHTIGEFDRRGIEHGPQSVLPLDFSNTVLNAAAGQVAIRHNLRGVNATIADGAASGLKAIDYACRLILGGRSDVVVAGGAEELSLEAYLGFEQAGALFVDSKQDADLPIPFADAGTGFALGEAAAFLVLEPVESARRRGARTLGYVRGSGEGWSNDCGNMASLRDAVVKAMCQALDAAGVSPAKVACIQASARGSLLEDAAEAAAIGAVFGDSSRQPIVTAIKGSVGESLGAGGPLQLLVLLESLRSGFAPGVAGATNPCARLNVCAQARTLEGSPYGLVNAVDADGSCYSLLIEAAN